MLRPLTPCLLAVQPANAQEPPGLNRVEQIGDGCSPTFVAQNDSGSALTALPLETVLFTRNALVERLTVLGFGALPKGATRVRQFDLKDLDCAALKRVLLNGIADCAPDGPGCTAPLAPSSRTDIEVLG